MLERRDAAHREFDELLERALRQEQIPPMGAEADEMLAARTLTTALTPLREPIPEARQRVWLSVQEQSCRQPMPGGRIRIRLVLTAAAVLLATMLVLASPIPGTVVEAGLDQAQAATGIDLSRFRPAMAPSIAPSSTPLPGEPRPAKVEPGAPAPGEMMPARPEPGIPGASGGLLPARKPEGFSAGGVGPPRAPDATTSVQP